MPAGDANTSGICTHIMRARTVAEHPKRRELACGTENTPSGAQASIFLSTGEVTMSGKVVAQEAHCVRLRVLSGAPRPGTEHQQHTSDAAALLAVRPV